MRTLRPAKLPLETLRRGSGACRSTVYRYGWRSLATLAEDVKSDSTFHIPVIDFSKFQSASSLAEKQQTADEIVNGFREVGFIYLDRHGISDDVVKHTFKKQ